MNNETKYLLIAGVVLVGGFFLLKNNPNLFGKKDAALPTGATNSNSSNKLDTNSLIRDTSSDSYIPDFQNIVGYKDAQGNKVIFRQEFDINGKVTNEYYEAYLSSGIVYYDKDGKQTNG